MYLMSKKIQFRTKMLDIAWLLLLKILKEPGFTFDRPFIDLYVKIRKTDKHYTDSINFIREHKMHFVAD